MGGCGSSTRSVIAGGEGNSPYPTTNVIEFITISSLGNAQDFGDLADPEWAVDGCSNATRGLFTGTNNPNRAAIEYKTIATKGNSIKFGDRTYTEYGLGAFSDPNRAVFAGGSVVNTINSVSYTHLTLPTIYSV